MWVKNLAMAWTMRLEGSRKLNGFQDEFFNEVHTTLSWSASSYVKITQTHRRIALFPRKAFVKESVYC